MKKYKRLLEKYKTKENDAFLFITNASLDPFVIELTKDFTAKTATKRSQAIIDKSMNPSDLPPIKINVNEKGNLQISDGNARLLVYQHYKQPIDKFLIVKKHSDQKGIDIFLKRLK